MRNEFVLIEAEYQKFFEEFNIDKTSGVLGKLPHLKFSTMPYIGSKYFEAKEKILFVGMDIGKDETPGRFQDFAERNSNIERDTHFNRHIAGTYCSALYLLKKPNDWDNVWLKFSTYQTYCQATKIKHHDDDQNPLSFVSLTNLHKFVTINRENRAGSGDRKFLKQEIEESLLLSEIKILQPDIIFFQGRLPRHDTLEKLKECSVKIILAMHPSNRIKGGMNPVNYVGSFKWL